MLLRRLVFLLGGVVARAQLVHDCTIGGRYGLPDDKSGSGKRVRVAFRSGADESASGYTAILSTHDTLTHATLDTAGLRGFGDKQVVTTGGMSSSYNSSSGILTLEQRGGYSAGTQSATLLGPGTLYTTHLDVEHGDASILISQAHLALASRDPDFHLVELTGNYSSCVNMAALESLSLIHI